jgi:hypothetical protein
MMFQNIVHVGICSCDLDYILGTDLYLDSL